MRHHTFMIFWAMSGLCFGVAVDGSAHASDPVTLLSQDRFVRAESRADLDRTGSNPDQDCILNDLQQSDAADFGPFESLAAVSPIQVECHTLLQVYAQSFQSSQLSSASLDFEGYVDMESYGYALADQGGHVLASSSAAVVFELTEARDYQLTGMLSAGLTGSSSLRLVDQTDETTLLLRTASDESDEFDLAGTLPAGSYEFRIGSEAECGRDCSALNAYQASMQFGGGVATEAMSIGMLKSFY